MILALTGFMGCGKSSVGRALSARLGWPLLDLDEYIEAREGRCIPDIFASDGEKAFRRLEVETLREILPAHEGKGLILSLGGGTLTSPEAVDLIREGALAVYLRARVETLVENLRGATAGRPMLFAAGSGDDERALRSRIAELMDRRSAVYESTAALITDTDGLGEEAICDNILSALEGRV